MGLRSWLKLQSIHFQSRFEAAEWQISSLTTENLSLARYRSHYEEEVAASHRLLNITHEWKACADRILDNRSDAEVEIASLRGACHTMSESAARLTDEMFVVDRLRSELEAACSTTVAGAASGEPPGPSEAQAENEVAMDTAARQLLFANTELSEFHNECTYLSEELISVKV